MKTLYISLFFLSMLLTSVCAADTVLDFGYRVEVRYVEKDEKTGKPVFATSNGTAIGVDLTEYGYEGNKFLLTAYHVIEQKKDASPAEIFIEIKDIGFIKCKYVKGDKELDLALIECLFEVPKRALLDKEKEYPVGEPIYNVGCPAGSKDRHPSICEGIITGPNPHTILLMANAPLFYHGSSGGGFFRKSNNKLCGISSSGLSDPTDDMGMKRGIGLFVPAKLLRMWLLDK